MDKMERQGFDKLAMRALVQSMNLGKQSIKWLNLFHLFFNLQGGLISILF